MPACRRKTKAPCRARALPQVIYVRSAKPLRLTTLTAKAVLYCTVRTGVADKYLFYINHLLR